MLRMSFFACGRHLDCEVIPLLQKSLSPYRLVLQDLGLQVATDLHNLGFEIFDVSIHEGPQFYS